ncbi:hypothetical protein [Alienimonas chondri]|uniref:DUF885 domain-containing protein n=1 Tax=Alienimonas chondri TaxID=2681879 RepID=A0ABX1VKD2_9PLAN|nr:hypothetical protein [Alienimonas chondri]NNJ27846.1 hypothetical protein [Alienimonas chondri]
MTTFALLACSLPALLAAEEARPLSPAEFDARFAAFVRMHRDHDLPPAATVPGGVQLLRSVDGVRGLRDGRRRDMRRSLTYKLSETRDDLIRQGLRWEKDLKRGRVSTASRRRGRETLAGPAEMRNARRLIDLIQSVVAPDVWDVNGGLATASYFDLYQVLVIRAPQSVHGEVNGALGGLRK